MFVSMDALETKIIVEEKMNKFEEMLRMAFPDLNKCFGKDIKEYTDKKIKDTECEDVSIEEAFSSDEWKMVNDFAKDDIMGAIYYALVIGFMNGVEWERKNIRH